MSGRTKLSTQVTNHQISHNVTATGPATIKPVKK